MHVLSFQTRSDRAVVDSNDNETCGNDANENDVHDCSKNRGIRYGSDDNADYNFNY